MESRRLVLTFPHKLLDKPVVYKLVKEYDLVFNILQARVTPREEGLLVLELTGKKENYAKGVKYLTDLGVKIEPLKRDIRRNDSRCTHCGVCISVCPTGALVIDKKTMKVNFDAAQCIACEYCVPACPVKAMEVKL
jgi:ferredoxin